MSNFDFIVVGAGTAGLPCAIFGARAGARVLLVEKQAAIGGTLPVSSGHLAAAGTRRQRSRGIADSTEAHFRDIQRLSHRTAREDLVRLFLQQSAWLVDWLEDEGFVFAPDGSGLAGEHDPYATPRLYRGADGGRSLLEVLSRLLQPLVDSGAVTLTLEAKVKALLTDQGRVVGVQYLQGGGLHSALAARGVVLATGGFAASPGEFEEIERFPLVSGAPAHATGDGLRMALGQGARLAGRGMFLPRFGGLPEPGDPRRCALKDSPLLSASERPPFEIYVDRFGKRFVAEDEPSIDVKQRALLKADGLTFFAVFDEAALEASEPMIAGWSKDEVRTRAGGREGVHKAGTAEELAHVAGIDGFGLATTIARYNGYVRDGHDPDFGRAFLPAPLEKAPFYAVRNHGVSCLTFAGVDVDAYLRVRREDTSIVEGLYAAGEVLGAGATSGNAFCAGMVTGPAIVFGKVIGERLALQDDRTTSTTAEVPRPGDDPRDTDEVPSPTDEVERPQVDPSLPTAEIPRPKF